MQTDAEVAAKLTKAQVRCLMLIPIGSERRAVSFSGSVASRLCQPAMNRPALLATTLTNLGRTAWYRHTADDLRVAQHLKQENSHG